MYATKIRAIGSSSGVVLPKEVLAQMGLKRGDQLYLTRGPDGSMRITPHDEAFARQMAVAEQVMSSHRDVFLALSKR